jgi:hypothetical protein
MMLCVHTNWLAGQWMVCHGIDKESSTKRTLMGRPTARQAVGSTVRLKGIEDVCSIDISTRRQVGDSGDAPRLMGG